MGAGRRIWDAEVAGQTACRKRKEPLTAKGPVVITCQVVDLDGTPVGGATVSPVGSGFREKIVRTNTDGQFRLTAEKIE